MYTDLFTPADVAKIETRLAEKSAARKWRFRDFHSQESKAIVSVLTSLVTFLFG